MIKSNDVRFYETIKKNKLKTFTSMLMIEKVAVKGTMIVIGLIVFCLRGYL